MPSHSSHSVFCVELRRLHLPSPVELLDTLGLFDCSESDARKRSKHQTNSAIMYHDFNNWVEWVE